MLIKNLMVNPMTVIIIIMSPELVNSGGLLGLSG